ncbi:winged helix DNA-binding protein [Sphingomonas sp. PvP018]|uniref:winged helix DNA-binding protein n=1 Tax=Sphingomonas sp. PvP018 TaxID=2817852 RepID=UPI001AE330FB|nr:winged helix DNA-binding protein [Sphingomonas sp. PvP018]MBP2513782.1 DNA-binding MarR family transcriptional regulator [Sphingomonas sp. PvP018]
MHAVIPSESHGSATFTSSQRALVDIIAGARRERNRRFAAQSKFFTDPAWDIFVDLAVEGLAGRLVSISSACIASHVPHTTALRYVRLLETEGLVGRMQDASDGRRFLLSLTPRGWSQFHGYVSWLDGRSSGLASPAADAGAIHVPSILDGPLPTRSVAPPRFRSVDGSRSSNA